ncbi:hypothetical protein BOX15_Mlig028653g1, partial [Macrostomum lignano]
SANQKRPPLLARPINAVKLIEEWRRGRGCRYRNWNIGNYYGCQLIKLLYTTRLHSKDRNHACDNAEQESADQSRVLLYSDKERPLLFMSRLVFPHGGVRVCSVERRQGRLALRRLGGLGAASITQRQGMVSTRSGETVYYSVPDRAACGHSAAVLTLSRNNCLLQLCLTWADQLQLDRMVSFSRTGIKFMALDWYDAGYSVVLDSTLCSQQQQQRQQSITKSFLILDVPALAFGTLISVLASAAPRGTKNIRAVQGALIVHCSGRSVRVYNMDQILSEATVLDGLAPFELDNGQLRVTPYLVSRLPPCLFELDCDQSEAEFGKSPWHVLYSPPACSYSNNNLLLKAANSSSRSNGNTGLFLIEPLVKTGPNATKRLELTVPEHADSDTNRLVAFHPDESGRIILTQLHSVSVLKATEDCLVTEFQFEAEMEQQIRSGEAATRSGRLVRQRHREAHNDGFFFNPRSVHCVDYEDELGVLAILCGQYHPGRECFEGSVHLFDSKSHQLLASLQLGSKFRWREHDQLNLCVDRDLVLVSASHRCQAYRHALACLL